MRLDHVQLAMAPGGEERADAFYRDLLGFEPVEKPRELAARGGRWYTAGTVGVHLGVEEGFQPSTKSHICLVVDDYQDLLERLTSAGYSLRPDEDLAGVTRAYVNDPFGNRIEIQKS